MSQVLGKLSSGTMITLVFFNDGIVVDQESKMVNVGMQFGAIGAAIVAGAKSKHGKTLQRAAEEQGPAGLDAVAGAMKRAKAIPYSSVRSVALTNRSKWGRVLTVTGTDGSATTYRFADRKNAKYPEVTSWLAYAPGFTAEAPRS